MIEQYNPKGISYVAENLITLQDALAKHEDLYYLEWLDLRTLGYIIDGGRFSSPTFIPVKFEGLHLRVSEVKT